MMHGYLFIYFYLFPKIDFIIIIIIIKLGFKKIVTKKPLAVHKQVQCRNSCQMGS